MIRLDPRTKLFLLLSVVLYTAFSETGIKDCAVIGFVTITGMLLGEFRKSIIPALIWFFLYFFALFGLPHIEGVIHTSLLAWLALIFKCYPCCMLAGIIIHSTQISEFMAGMAKMKIPRTIVIPLAVMFRYFPVVKEDWSYIRDAMALRGLRPTPLGFIKNPSAVIDALYVPMLVSASKTADELSLAAVTRGIETPRPRTSRLKIRFGSADIIILISYLGLIIFGIMG
ncbi:MAG: energy-coupling factor transporter transmembrane protein EcfT [Lachnospiraceae bacterium]|nr:energy-coupling factor transporter transmembrane protein EcfT [Lachnospiraceae bacterium]